MKFRQLIAEAWALFAFVGVIVGASMFGRLVVAPIIEPLMNGH